MQTLQIRSRKQSLLRTISLFTLALVICCAFAERPTMAGYSDEDVIRAIVLQKATAHEKGDLATIEKLWAHDDSVTVAESGSFNYGWTEFRDNHLRPEIEGMKNVKLPIEAIKIHVKGDLAWVTYSYKMTAEFNGRAIDGAGAATMVLEKRGKDWLIIHEHISMKRRPPSANPPAAKPEQE
jgi:ketosteroid isomerase-like protein